MAYRRLHLTHILELLKKANFCYPRDSAVLEHGTWAQESLVAWVKKLMDELVEALYVWLITSPCTMKVPL